MRLRDDRTVLPSTLKQGRARMLFSAFFAAVALLVVLSTLVRAQNRSGFQGLDFRVPLEYFPPPHETQVKTLLEGAEAQPLSNGRIQLKDATLKTFNTNGSLYIVASAPECVFNSVDRTLSSTGALYVKTGDGKFFMEGVGFLLRTNLVLSISSRVKAASPIAP